MDYSKYVNHVDYKADRMAWRAEEGHLVNLFESDLAAEYGVEANPKRHKLFGIAWEMGHHAGYSEVAGHYGELVELIW